MASHVQFILLKQFLVFISLAVFLCPSFTVTQLLLVLFIPLMMLFKEAPVRCTPRNMHQIACACLHA